MNEQAPKDSRLSEQERMELAQLRRIDVAVRAFVDSEPKISLRCLALWADLLTALYDGRPRS